jgi:hypothetical protein
MDGVLSPEEHPAQAWRAIIIRGSAFLCPKPFLLEVVVKPSRSLCGFPFSGRCSSERRTQKKPLNMETVKTLLKFAVKVWVAMVIVRIAGKLATKYGGESIGAAIQSPESLVGL